MCPAIVIIGVKQGFNVDKLLGNIALDLDMMEAIINWLRYFAFGFLSSRSTLK
jgi:hypothetical protein